MREHQWGQKYPLDSFGLELERGRASQRYRHHLGEDDVTKPLSLRFLNRVCQLPSK